MSALHDMRHRAPSTDPEAAMRSEAVQRAEEARPSVALHAAPFAPRKAMVMAAGFGRRMRPLTVTTPKPLIEVAGRSLIDHGLDRLAAAGIEEAIVNVHYLAELMEVHLERRDRPRIHISDEREALLDTGGAIRRVLGRLGDAPFIAMNSDSFWIEGATPNLSRLGAAWQDDAMDAILLLAPTVSATGYAGRGDFLMDSEGRLKRRPERSVAPFVYAGVGLFHPRLFTDTPEGSFSLNLVFDRAIAAGRLYGLRLDGLWLHVGTPEAVGLAERAIAESAA